jgi:hypothetical protein
MKVMIIHCGQNEIVVFGYERQIKMLHQKSSSSCWVSFVSGSSIKLSHSTRQD